MSENNRVLILQKTLNFYLFLILRITETKDWWTNQLLIVLFEMSQSLDGRPVFLKLYRMIFSYLNF